MEKKELKMKSTVASAASSTVGAAIGIVAGSAITSQAQAAEPTLDETEQVVNTENHSGSSTAHTSSVHATTPPPHQPSVQEPTIEPTSPETPSTPEQIDQVEVEVLSYETIPAEDGSQVDVAVVTADGQPAIIADVDSDGYADVIASDLNNNGELETDEIVDLPTHTLAMQPLHDAVVPPQPDDNDYIGQTTDNTNTDDYINDANVQEFMA